MASVQWAVQKVFTIEDGSLMWTFLVRPHPASGVLIWGPPMYNVYFVAMIPIKIFFFPYVYLFFWVVLPLSLKAN